MPKRAEGKGQAFPPHPLDRRRMTERVQSVGPVDGERRCWVRFAGQPSRSVVCRKDYLPVG